MCPVKHLTVKPNPKTALTRKQPNPGWPNKRPGTWYFTARTHGPCITPSVSKELSYGPGKAKAWRLSKYPKSMNGDAPTIGYPDFYPVPFFYSCFTSHTNPRRTTVNLELSLGCLLGFLTLQPFEMFSRNAAAAAAAAEREESSAPIAGLTAFSEIESIHLPSAGEAQLTTVRTRWRFQSVQSGKEGEQEGTIGFEIRITASSGCQRCLFTAL